jgi:DNA polymerase I
LNAYFNTFTRLAEYLEEVKTFARKHGYTETLFGRRRHFPGINSGAPFIRAEQERRAINAPIQGTSADIIRIAMVKIHKYLTEKKQEGEAAMLLQVHDELVFEIKTKSLEKLIPELVSRMTDVIPKEKSNGVPVAVEVKVGSNWEEMEKWKQ